VDVDIIDVPTVYVPAVGVVVVVFLTWTLTLAVSPPTLTVRFRSPAVSKLSENIVPREEFAAIERFC
jgi:hypothetical protein